jgi:hypothetical protein
MSLGIIVVAMETKAFITVVVLSALTLALAGCATDKPRVPQVTIPNGRSPATDNAPRAPMNGTDTLRTDFNHGNGVLWVWLQPGGILFPQEGVGKDGTLRVKFFWWRAVPGKFSITGRRLDAPAPPLCTSPSDDSAGPFGFTPGYLYFPSEGYWEITGRIDDHESLTFVVHVIEAGVTTPNGNSPTKANAPHAPMNDSEVNRKGWNHGNDVLWVFLRPTAYAPDMVEKDGSLRIKSGWWKGFPGKFSVEGRRLDAPAPPLRCSVNAEALDDVIGPIPALFFFPTEGYWEITGHLNGKSLTFVIHVVKKIQ